MQNVDVKIVKNKMVIEVDLSKDFGPSKSGKTIMIASSQGNEKIKHGDSHVVLGINVYRHKE